MNHKPDPYGPAPKQEVQTYWPGNIVWLGVTVYGAALGLLCFRGAHKLLGGQPKLVPDS